jgi:hypothetical protein
MKKLCLKCIKTILIQKNVKRLKKEKGGFLNLEKKKKKKKKFLKLIKLIRVIVIKFKKICLIILNSIWDSRVNSSHGSIP